MLAIQYKEEGGLQVVDLPEVPCPGEGEALVKIIRCGICGTDIEITRGYVPGFNGTLGHEFVGVVVAAEDAPGLKGKRVCADINIPCEKPACCNQCYAGKDLQRNHCPARRCLGIRDAPGCMASFVIVPIRNLHVVPSHLSDSAAVYAEPFAAALRLFESGAVSAKEFIASGKVAILGDGKLGWLIAEVFQFVARFASLTAEDTTQKIVIFGRHPDRWFVKSKLVTFVSSPAEQTACPPQWLNHFSIVIDATGCPSSLFFATQITQPRGLLILKSTSARLDSTHGVQRALSAIVVKELKIEGSRCGSLSDALGALSGTYVPSYLRAGDKTDGDGESVDRARRCAAEMQIENFVDGELYGLQNGLKAFERATTDNFKVHIIVDTSHKINAPTR